MSDLGGAFDDKNGSLALSLSIRNATDSANPVETRLRTNDRVLARVTDGIYRQPGSALRELISNAYDADATKVVIKTDAPRFDRISVEDNGHGMTPEALAYLIGNIGGSAKRTSFGASLGMTSSEDPLISPGGRRLIGKIGVGLFSVSQLTHSFQIVTKTKGDNFRTVATVALRQYSEEAESSPIDEENKYEAGKVLIWRESALDTDTSGTTIVLDQIRRQAKETLRDHEMWQAVAEANFDAAANGEKPARTPPLFHIGRVDQAGFEFEVIGQSATNRPWEAGDSPHDAFQKLVDSVWARVDIGDPNPRLEHLFDFYLRMAWNLSLALPVPYCGGHLFDKPSTGWVHTYLLANRKGHTPLPLDSTGLTIRQSAELAANNTPDFSVFFDDLQLMRPIRYDILPRTKAALQTPLAFIGKCEEKFEKIPPALSGGGLHFQAYFFWAPKIAPVEHRGALIRIHESSGTLFDPTFLHYQVKEIVRLQQITCEIFVTKGLDGALNIDRESFNTAHPHAVFLTKWVHNALRQVANVQKKLSADLRDAARSQVLARRLSVVEQYAGDVWRTQTDDPGAEPPEVEFSDASPTSAGETYVFSRSIVASNRAPNTSRARAESAVLEQKMKAITQILAAFGILETLSKSRQEQLLQAIYSVMDAPEE